MNNAETGLASSNAKARVIILCAGSLFCALVLLFGLIQRFAGSDELTVDTLSKCIERVSKSAESKISGVEHLTEVRNFCYNSLGSQLLIDEETIRRDNFVFQRHENVILLVMVVVITLSGVALAGLQLLASYRLAAAGKGELSSGGELTYSKDTISFRSSVVGLVILAVSFAFFLVFVIDVYELKEGSQAAGPGMPTAAVQIAPFVPTKQAKSQSPPQK